MLLLTICKNNRAQISLTSEITQFTTEKKNSKRLLENVKWIRTNNLLQRQFLHLE